MSVARRAVSPVVTLATELLRQVILSEEADNQGKGIQSVGSELIIVVFLRSQHNSTGDCCII